MRIVHCGKFYPPEYNGGVESALVTLNHELVRRGVSVTAVVAAWRSRGRTEVVDGVRVVRAPSLGLLLSQPVAPTLPALLRAEAGDLVHSHQPNPLADWAAARDRGRPLVVTHHSDIVRQRALWPLIGPVVRGAFARARFIVAASEQVLRGSPELRDFTAKCRVIPYGIDPARFAASPTITARAKELRWAWGDRPVILAVGRMVGYKGFNVLIEAAKGLDAAVVLVGGGPEAPRLKALAGANVIFAGHVSDADLPAYYHACDVFCLPSLTNAEAFGVVLLEAMACGKPLVTSALPTGVSAVNRDGQTGVSVAPGDIGGLFQALSTLIRDDATRRTMGERAREVMVREYTASLMADRYLQLYRDALA